MGTITPEVRSQMMAAVKGKNTKPEIIVRKMLHAMGFRFRLHRKELPGRPDIVLPKYRTVVLVNGCFWHQHPGCQMSRRPKSRPDYWEPKLDGNIQRDKKNRTELVKLGWRVITIWECELENPEEIAAKLKNLIENKSETTVTT